MPGSDPTRAGGARRFWCALVACVALIAANCLLNLLIDPVGQVRAAPTHALNRTMPPSAIAFMQRSGSPSAYERRIATTSADTFLIGTSREARGFDTCDRPNLLRVAGSNWGIRDISRIHDRILETRKTPATLLIELAVASDSGAAETDRDRVAHYAALSPRTTLLSLQTVAASVLQNDGVAAGEAECRPLAGDASDWAAAAERFEYGARIFDTGKAPLRRGRAMVERMLETAEHICASTGIRHTILFFTLPATPNLPFTQRFDASLSEARRDIETVLRAAAGHGTCRIRYLDYMTTPPGSADQQRLWMERDEWQDFIHFSPRLGEIALNAILQVANDEKW